MVDSVPIDDRVRAPMQDRSRRAWERILEVGTWILENEGIATRETIQSEGLEAKDCERSCSGSGTCPRTERVDGTVTCEFSPHTPVTKQKGPPAGPFLLGSGSGT